MKLLIDRLFSISSLLIFYSLVYESHCVDYYTEKPSFVLTCRLKDPDFSKCFTKSAIQLNDALTKGLIPEVTEKFGTWDPMKVRDVRFEQNNNEAASLKANLSNLMVSGLNGMIINEGRTKKDFSWITKNFFPKMRINADYTMDGRILILPLTGSGKMSIEIDNMNVLVMAKTRLYEKGGFTFGNVTKLDVDISIGKLHTQIDNLFNGQSKEIADTTNKFFNENWEEVFTALKPIITKTVANVLYDVMHLIFNLIPGNFFIEDIPTSKELYGEK